MFTLSGSAGLSFRGPLEELVEVERSRRTKRDRPLERDGREPDADAATRAAAHEGYSAAAAAYAQSLHPAVERGPVYHAYQVMTTGVFTVEPDARLAHAWKALADRGIGQAPVVDRQHGLVGLISRADLLGALDFDRGALRDAMTRTVAQVMTTPVISTAPVSDVRRIARVMIEFGLPAVPVVSEAGALVGIVSRGDILRAVVANPPLTLWA